MINTAARQRQFTFYASGLQFGHTGSYQTKMTAVSLGGHIITHFVY